MEWISVKDRLPEQKEESDSFGEMRMISDQVLSAAFGKDGTHGTQFIHFDYFVNGEWASSLDDDVLCVTAMVDLSCSTLLCNDRMKRDEISPISVTHWMPIIFPELEE